MTDRPEGRTLLFLLDNMWTKKALTDEMINEISLRWREFRHLRELYLDEQISKEFQSYRANFASEDLSWEERAAIVEPGIIKSSEPTTALEQSRRFDPEFKARFHKCLCLQSIAIVGRALATASSDQRLYPIDNPVAKDIAKIVSDIWCKEAVIVDGAAKALSLNVKIDCLEVFDFLYMFLIRKIMPLEQLDPWTEKDVDSGPYSYDMEESFMREGPADSIDRWYSLMDYSRWRLQPEDLVDLIRGQAWKTSLSYPQDKSLYMRVRGMFDDGSHGDMDWYSCFERSSMVGVLRSDHKFRMFDSENPCWWDQIRIKIGSPFLLGNESKYLAELEEIEAADLCKAEGLEPESSDWEGYDSESHHSES